MKLCTKQGCGVCIGCSHLPPEGYGDLCRYVAEDMLDCLVAIIDTKWTKEQAEIFADFEISKDDTE
jgi:hypothetical protein